STSGLQGEPAFQKILSWKTGNFEILPPDPNHPRTIEGSYQGLLLESAQAIDEAQAPAEERPAGAGAGPHGPEASALKPLAKFEGVEFVLTTGTKQKPKPESWGVENPELLADFTWQTVQRFRALGESLQAGLPQNIEGFGLNQQVAMISRDELHLCVGFRRSVAREQVGETMKKILSKWAS
ncbi:MAG: DUF4388 domain-containing protein, partial [Verrucomicrobiota bacterium]